MRPAIFASIRTSPAGGSKSLCASIDLVTLNRRPSGNRLMKASTRAILAAVGHIDNVLD
jgi:hypothetical protein